MHQKNTVAPLKENDNALFTERSNRFASNSQVYVMSIFIEPIDCPNEPCPSVSENTSVE